MQKVDFLEEFHSANKIKIILSEKTREWLLFYFLVCEKYLGNENLSFCKENLAELASILFVFLFKKDIKLYILIN